MQQHTNEGIIRQQALARFSQLGYEIIDGSQEEQGNCSATGRQHINEVVLVPRLRRALQTLNQDCPPELIEEAVSELTRNRALSGLAQASKDVWMLLRGGVKIELRSMTITTAANDQANSEDTHRTLRVIQWDKAEQNDFVLVSHFWTTGNLGRRCLNLVAFVNGLPLVLLEITDRQLPDTFDHIDQDYKSAIPALFWHNAFLVVADAYTCKMGSSTSSWEHFFQWKRIHNENEPESTKLVTLIEGTCEKERLLDIVENFTLFDQSKGLKRLIARNHQYLGVNAAIASLEASNKERAPRLLTGEGPLHGKLGVFWQTQGSGKSYSMVFFARKVHRRVANDYTFVVITDRDDLGTQIFENFRHTGTIVEDEKEINAKSGSHLKRLLSEKHLILFTLIQKFRSDKPGQPYKEISSNEKIIIMADEAHRTQYDTLARNMRDALPRASFIGFTGTPLMDDEEQTRNTFGNYISIYNFRRAIDDGITVPLINENRTPQIGVINDEFHEEMTKLLEEAMLNEGQEQKIIEQYARSANFLIKGDRLDLIAEHIVSHFMSRGYINQTKAMVVSLDKITTVRTYNRVCERWQRYKETLQRQLLTVSDPDEKAELARKLEYMEETEMAVVVSASDGDEKRFAKFSEEFDELVEITPHRLIGSKKRAEQFKQASHPLRIAFVCGMWITGFDVPSLSTIYLDRPLDGHTLMQTVARANRVYRDKTEGIIVDYASNQRTLATALAVYAREDSSYHAGDLPIGRKDELIQALRDSLVATEQFCLQLGLDIPALLASIAAKRNKTEQRELVLPAVDMLVVHDAVKLRALQLTTEVSAFYKAILPDQAEPEFTLRVHLFQLIKEGIHRSMSVSSPDYVAQQAKLLMRESLTVHELEGALSPTSLQPQGIFDFRDIDLDALNVKLRTGYRNINIEEWRHQIEESVKRMVQKNPGRVKHLEKLYRIVDRYNEGCADFATYPQMKDPQANVTQHPVLKAEFEQLQNEFIENLVEVTDDIKQDQRRHEQEGMSEEELAIFDYLIAERTISAEEHGQLKQIACALLAELRPIFAIPDWHKKSQQRSQVSIAIEDALHISMLNKDEMLRLHEELFLHIQKQHKNDGSTFVA